ncbi:hypothetical protein [Runella zeae]|uniref:hypothetical protein n=1 Tax=Runella zeae TaxID=94255 RepID=UPI000404E234|nr:hypothetical protein [Runella zeae]
MNQETLNEIERLAGLFMQPEAIAVIIGISSEDFWEELYDTESPIYIHYYRGKYKSEAELRQAIVKLAKQGSSPAQGMAIKFLNEIKTEEA